MLLAALRSVVQPLWQCTSLIYAPTYTYSSAAQCIPPTTHHPLSVDWNPPTVVCATSSSYISTQNELHSPGYSSSPHHRVVYLFLIFCNFNRIVTSHSVHHTLFPGQDRYKLRLLDCTLTRNQDPTRSSKWNDRKSIHHQAEWWAERVAEGLSSEWYIPTDTQSSH